MRSQQVGMAAVSGVLLNPVEVQLSDGDAVLTQSLSQILMLGRHDVGSCLLTGQVGVGGVDRRLLGHRLLGGGVAGAVQLQRALAEQDPTIPPVALGLGQVAEKTE